jgi:hypothetical protein
MLAMSQHALVCSCAHWRSLLILPPLDKLMRPQEVVSAVCAHQAVAGGGEQPVNRLCCQRSAVCPGEHKGVRGCQLGTPAAQPRLQLPDDLTSAMAYTAVCCTSKRQIASIIKPSKTS